MLIKIITIMLLSAGVLFPQIDTLLKYYDEQEGNKIDLIITKPVKLKNKLTGELAIYNIEKKISGVSKIISLNDSSINVWNGKSKTIELEKIKAIRIEDPNSPSYVLIGSLSGLGLGLITGLIIGSIKYQDENWGVQIHSVPKSSLYGGLIGICIGTIMGLIANSGNDDYITIPVNKLTKEEKREKLIKHLKFK